MAYVKRTKYTIKNDDNVKDELLNVLLEKGIASNKARNLVYYPRPMSLIRWSNYLDTAEMKIFLIPFNEDTTNEVEETETIEENMSDIEFGF